jgi:hypothetical protein
MIAEQESGFRHSRLVSDFFDFGEEEEGGWVS